MSKKKRHVTIVYNYVLFNIMVRILIKPTSKEKYLLFWIDTNFSSLVLITDVLECLEMNSPLTCLIRFQK